MHYRNVFFAICLFLSAFAANAAEIAHKALSNGDGLITIEGAISSGDLEKFRQISLKYKRAIVGLNSNGGQLSPAIEIGKIIKIAGFVTVVPKDSVCASSCALIWVAGSKRLLSPTGRVGFHASYRDNKGKMEESGVANALIGNYLTLLGLPEKAIIFATTAPPNSILWLTQTNKGRAGIDFEDFNPSDMSKQSPQSTYPSSKIAAPIIHIPIPSKSSTTTQSQSPHYNYGNDNPWMEYAESVTGAIYYYNIKTINYYGSFIRVWVKSDFQHDKTVSYRSSKTLYEVNCKDTSYRSITRVDYDKNGLVLGYYSDNGLRNNFSMATPESIAESLISEVC